MLVPLCPAAEGRRVVPGSWGFQTNVSNPIRASEPWGKLTLEDRTAKGGHVCLAKGSAVKTLADHE